jgi:hypothetical protein
MFEHPHRERTIAAMSADLGHDEGFVTPAFEALAPPGLGCVAIVFPGIVLEGDAAIEGPVDNFDDGFLILRRRDDDHRDRVLRLGRPFFANLPERDRQYNSFATFLRRRATHIAIRPWLRKTAGCFVGSFRMMSV